MSAAGPIVIERVYAASPEEVWEMWTTKEGIEAWWGPEGFAVTVRAIDVRPGGQLDYAMSAVAPEMRAFMAQSGMPATTEHHVTYTEVDPPRVLAYRHPVDFVPGVTAYDVTTRIELAPHPGGKTALRLVTDRLHDDTWTGRTQAGWESELGKLDRALAAAGR